MVISNDASDHFLFVYLARGPISDDRRPIQINQLSPFFLFEILKDFGPISKIESAG